MNWLEDFQKDLKYATRSLSANPLFTTVAILTLALGIGANSAIFSVINAVVLRTLPVQNPQRLYYLRCDGMPNGASNTGNFDSSFSEPVFQRLSADKQVFSDVMAYVPLGLNKIAVRAGNLPEEASAEMVSGNFFTGLGVRPRCGRLLTAADERDHAPVAVLNYGYWSRRFAGSCTAIGQAISINGVPLTIVGVTARRFNGIEGDTTDLWIPLQTRPELSAWGMQDVHMYAAPNWWCLLLAGRLAPGVNKAQAEAAATPVFQRAAYEHLGGKPLQGEKPTRLHLLQARGLSGYKEAYSKPLTLLLVMVAVILLIACGNVSLLLAARNTARRREFSVRLALGGSRGRLFRQLMVETLLLVFAGALLGWLFALAATQVLAKWSEIEADLTPDWRVLAFTLAISLAAGILSGLAPILGAAKVSLAETLKTSGSTAFRDRAKTRLGQLTTALQVALCLVLLAGAALLVRTLQNLKNVDLGFHSESLLVFGVTPHLPANADDQAVTFYRGLIDKLRTLPQVEAVTLMQNRIGSQWSNNSGAILDGRNPNPGQQSPLRWNAVGPDYFQTLRIALLTGRDFNDGDGQKTAKVAIVNRTFVDRYLQGRSPIGHTVSFSKDSSFTIVGVAANSKYTDVQEKPQSTAYFPYTQVPGLGTMHVEVHTQGHPKLVIPEIQRTLAGFAPDLAMLQPMTQREQFDESITSEALIARLAACFGFLAVALVATGLYGTVAYNVNRRTSELGIRLALGASRGQVLWMILREGLQICAIGLLVGLPLAFAAARLLRSLLYGLTPSDPASMTAAVLGILMVTVAACLIPARRAASIDPTIALRNE